MCFYENHLSCVWYNRKGVEREEEEISKIILEYVIGMVRKVLKKKC